MKIQQIRLLDFSLTSIDSLYILYVDSLYMKGESNMKVSKKLLRGSTTMLVLKLLEERDMYGYLIIEELAKKSNDTFDLKAGTLYPILHGLENDGMLESYEDNPDNSRVRKYYSITKKGKKLLKEEEEEWNVYVSTINQVLEGGARLAII